MIAVLIFVVAEIVQLHPWSRHGGGLAPASSSAALPVTADDLAGFQVFLRRQGCNGGCPYYALKAGGRTLQYIGVRDVVKRGKFAAPLAKEQLRRLLELVEKASFFSLNESYDLGSGKCRAARADAPTFTVGVTLNGQTKVVTANEGCADVPKQLTELAAGIDRITESSRWTGVAAAAHSPATAP